MAHAWYIIHTLSGQEQKVLDSINKRIDVEEMGAYIKEVFIAKEKVVDVRGGEKKVSMKKLFPGYVFINVDLRDEDDKVMPEPLNYIKETPGAIGLVGGDDPEPDDQAVFGQAFTEDPTVSGRTAQGGAPRMLRRRRQSM